VDAAGGLSFGDTVMRLRDEGLEAILYTAAYACTSNRNFTGYCNRRLEDLFHRQSRETDPQRRRELVWDIDRTLQEEGRGRSIFIRGVRPAGSPR